MSDHFRGLPDTYDQWRTHSGEPREVEENETDYEGDKMPSYTYEDRLLIMAEQSLWTVVDILKAESETITTGVFGDNITALMESAKMLAEELRKYNDQWEE